MEKSESIFNQISDSDRSRTDFTSETQLHEVYPPLHCHFYMIHREDLITSAENS